jgi:predicted RNA binding protein YcfA (HicA-like mRNA interferase family)
VKQVSGKRMCNILKKHGWVKDRVSGSHHIFTKRGNPNHLSVPVHGNKPLGKGFQLQLMKDAGLTAADL